MAETHRILQLPCGADKRSGLIAAFRFFVTELWQRTLRRRSQKDCMTWERFMRLANDWFPKPHVLHPWPQARFAVTHPRWEPYAGIPLVRICAGALSNERPYRECRGSGAQ